MSIDTLSQRFKDREAKVAVVGMGYVGLPLALVFGDGGFEVVGLDTDAPRMALLNEGRCYLGHLGAKTLPDLVKRGRLSGSTDFADVADCDAAIICVPTPLNGHREPDMSYVVSAAERVGAHLRRGQLVVLESTTYPGTTDGLLRDTLEAASGLKAGEDFFLAYSPEREDPGNPSHSTRTIPKVVGGLTNPCRELASAMYEAVLDKVVPVSSPRVAETTKLLENIFRCVNIALVNELKTLCFEMGIDVWEAIEAASSKPFGYMPFYPGPGLGGHCIPIDPFYLTWKAREYGLHTRFIELAGEVNTAMPKYVVQRTAAALNTRGKPLQDSEILVCGVAYKKDVEDTRESPALKIIQLLQADGAKVVVHDPYVPSVNVDGHDFVSLHLSPERIAQADAVLILTDHTNVDYDRLVTHAQLVIDTRNVTRAVRGPRDKVVAA